MISFNFAAIGQAFFSALFIFALHGILSYGGSDYDLIGGSRELAFSIMLLGWLTMIMELIGLKGRILYIHSWLICIIGSILAFLYVYPHGFFEAPSSAYNIFVYGSACLIPLVYWWRNRVDLTRKWEQKKATLQEFKERSNNPGDGIPPHEFWTLASLCFYKPSNIYLFLYPVWNRVYPEICPRNEFIQHYRDLMAMLPLENLVENWHVTWMEEFTQQLQADAPHYMHKPLSLNRAHRVVMSMETKTKREAGVKL